ncbi:conjugative transposon protein TraK [Runella slithyformis]|uniref:Bacteroides conjugative transposon TraK protein n=1 Tax=Runella slithyformis (strain ATCC 29530 / DSM 19594 / LMG 11500 / NCIMB 11436 / LSU 4) TaxID=761193 RepID=A0A7U4E8Z5_RUNSL|nr:conjugative transposon protein TraK [Runella slithyformis]AEI52136.1 Bacteroides conjugative transposon TraK protein [Runella slithyformis DSM 19594]
MEELLKLQKHFNRVKIITIITLSALGLVCITTLVLSYRSTNEFSKRIYIVNKNAQFEAIAGTVTENRPVEIGYHVRRFHELFFNVIPDAEEIENSTKKSFYLADESAKKLYDDLKEQHFYSDIIQGNVVQKIAIDSVAINSALYPYEAITYATIKQTRATTGAVKKIVTHCRLEDTPRSLRSPNGLFMRNFKIIESKIWR